MLVLACVLIAAFRVWARRKLTPRVAAALLLAFLVFGPLSAVLLRHPIIYDAHRHFLFLLPPLAAGSGLALEHVLIGRYAPVSKMTTRNAQQYFGLARFDERDSKLEP